MADNTINAMTNNADAHTNNTVKTTRTDSNVLSMMNTSASDVIIERTNDAYVMKEAIMNNNCALRT
jgi:hypothetical protein